MMLPAVVVTDDPAVADEVRRLTALLGVALSVRPVTPGALAARGTAVVMVDAAAAAALADRRSAAPDGTQRWVLCTAGTPDEGVWRSAVELGASRVLSLPTDAQLLLDELAVAVEPVVGPAPVLAITGGCGGAGASVLAVVAAMAAARSTGGALLVDADPYGGGLDLLFGAEALPGTRWPELADTRGRVPAAALGAALLPVGPVRLLSWDRGPMVDVPTAAAVPVLEAAIRSGQPVVVDLGRPLDDVGRHVVAVASLVVVVVLAQLRAVAAAARGIDAVRRAGATPVVVVRDAGPRALGAAEIGTALGVPVLGSYVSETAVRDAVEQGRLARRTRGPLHDVALAVLAAAGMGSVTQPRRSVAA